MLIDFIAMGYEESKFWTLTPRQFYIYEKAAVLKNKTQYDTMHDLLVYVGWLSGVVSNSSKPVKLYDLLPHLKENSVIENPLLLIAQLEDLSLSMPKKDWAQWIVDLELEQKPAE